MVLAEAREGASGLEGGEKGVVGTGWESSRPLASLTGRSVGR